MSYEDFVTSEDKGRVQINRTYAKNSYKKYLQLSDADIQKALELRKLLGKVVLYQRGKKQVRMIVKCVPLFIGDKSGIHGEIPYRSFPYNVRLNYADKPKNYVREWEGFWTYNLNKITILENEKKVHKNT